MSKFKKFIARVKSAMKLAYPATEKYSVLSKCHAAYDRDRMEEHEALFEGGKLFDAQLDKGKFLIKRESEKPADSPGGPPNDLRYENPPAVEQARNTNVGNSYKLRKKYVSYKQRVGGLINWIIASVLSSAPIVVATRDTDNAPGLVDQWLAFFGIGKQPKSDPEIAFYHALNSDADGRGASLLACKGKMMRDLAVHNRAFAGIAFPETAPAAKGDALKHRDAGGNDASLAYFPALEMDDWECDADGLCMLRRHYITLERTVATRPPDKKVETWVFITPEAFYTYSIEWKASEDGTGFTAPDAEASVSLKSTRAHQLAEMPVRMVEVPVNVMERLRPSAIDQINLNCDMRWAIQQCVYALPIFFTKRQIAAVNPDTMAMNLDVGDSATVLSPTGAIVAPIAGALDRNDDEMYEALMALALQAAAQPSNGRQSSLAKRMDFESFVTFLQIFSEPLRAVLIWQLETIRRIRNNAGILVTVQGLDNFDLASVTQIITDSIQALSIQGMTPTMKKSILMRVYRAFMGPQTTPEQLEAVVKEVAAADMTAPNEPRPQGSGNEPRPQGEGDK